jgi:hypothetical protein
VLYEKFLISVYPVFQPRVTHYRERRRFPYPYVFSGTVPTDKRLILFELVKTGEVFYFQTEPVEFSSRQ